MSENGDPLENAVAERINGILKHEYLKHYPLTDLESGLHLLDDIVNRYNTMRPHESINLMTPEVAHKSQSIVHKTWSRKTESITL